MIARLGRIPSIFVLAAAIAAGALWAVSTAHASEGVTFYLSPGPNANGTTGTLNCGWHTVCVPPNEIGDGLDWNNPAGSAVHFQGFGYRSLGGGSSLWIGTVYIGQRDGNCKNTVADIVDPIGNYIGRVNYTHSSLAVSEGSSSYIYATNAGYFNQRTIATTAGTDLTTCTIEGAHLHQSATSGAWTRYGSYPNEDGARGVNYNITSISNAMYYASWDA